MGLAQKPLLEVAAVVQQHIYSLVLALVGSPLVAVAVQLVVAAAQLVVAVVQLVGVAAGLVLPTWKVGLSYVLQWQTILSHLLH